MFVFDIILQTLNGLVISRKFGSRVHRVTTLDRNHTIMRLFPTLSLNCTVQSVNGRDIRQLHNRTLNSYLRTHRITEMEFMQDAETIFNRQTIDNRQQRASRQKKSQDAHLRKVNATLPIRLHWSIPCRFGCGFTHLSNSTRGELLLCCYGGRIRNMGLFNLRPLPPDIIDLYEENLTHMGRASSIYNNILAPVATGVENDHNGGFEVIRGDHCVKLAGRTYHYNARSTRSTDPSGNLSYFTLDSHHHIEHDSSAITTDGTLNTDAAPTGYIRNGTVYDKIHPDIMTLLTQQLRQFNHYMQFQIPDYQMPTTTMVATMQLDPEYNEVAQITAIAPAGNRVISVGTGGSVITMESEEVEPLCYPLIFFGGEHGWGSGNNGVGDEKATFRQYLASRMLMPDVIDELGNFMTMPALLQDNQSARRIVCNRLQVLSRLQQVYICDQTSRAIDFRLDWIKKNQRTIFGGTSKRGAPSVVRNGSDSEDSDNSEGSDQDTTGPDFLPSSFFGSKRYLKKKALNALAVLAEHGKATFFLTMTCNINWPEILEKLLPGQTAYDRPDITSMVFKKRLEMFLSMLESGELFPLRGCKVQYIMRAIEFQHRGLPHAHIVFKIVDAPDQNTSEEGIIVNYIDTFISAEMPIVTPGSSTEVEDARYCELVRKHNMHNCIIGPRGCKANQSCICKRGYSDDSSPVLTTHFSELGYPIYRRRHAADRRVVPHSRPMIMAWDGHLNLEYAAGVKCALYLYSYLYKGPKSVGIDVKAVDPTVDETSLYLKARVICSMDACWRTFGYQTYPSSKPRVRVIKVKTEDMVNYLLRSSKLCDIVIYLNRPAQLAGLKYVEFNKEYITCPTLPARYAQNTNLLNTEYYTININTPHGKTLRVHVCKRSSLLQKPVTRMEMLYVMAGDIWYLRLILLKEAPRSFKDALSHQGIQYSCYQQAAIAKGYVEFGVEIKDNFTELTQFCTPRKLRSMFCIMLIHGFPMRIVYDDPILRNTLMSDFLADKAKGDVDVAIHMMLLDFKRNLELGHGKSLRDYGFDEPADVDTELQRERALINKTVELKRYDELCLKTPNNLEQQEVFDVIAAAVDQPLPLQESQYFFVSGPGGVGKSEVCKKLHSYFRSKGYLIKICASTTLAATLFVGAETAHAAFKFPVIDDSEADAEERVETKLSSCPQRMEFYRECRVIFWDEFVSNHKQLFEAVIRQFELSKIRLVFVCCGDFRQILPVVRNGNMQDTVAATISSSVYWEKFNILYLRQNMRLKALQKCITNETSEADKEDFYAQTRYNNSIMAIAGGLPSIQALNARGTENSDCFILGEGADAYSTRVALRGVEVYTEDQLQDALSFLYPNGFAAETATTNCVLAATNKAGNVWNAAIQQLNPETARTYKSYDQLSEVDDTKGILKGLLSEKLLESVTVSGVPAHSLTLKVNDVCLVLRSLQPLGLATNQRVRILKFYPNCVQVETLQDKRVVYIPRIRFNFNLRYGDSYRVLRTQLPLRLAYCMTYNKSQGQTLGRVLLDTTEEPFAHGHCYVALSRVRSKHDVRIFSLKENVCFEGDNKIPVIINVVYPQVLLPDVV